MNQENQDLIEKIAKLHKKAESAKELGSEAEAAAFAAGVQRLLIQHKLSMSDLQYAAEDDPIDESYIPVTQHGVTSRWKRVRWVEDLALVVAKAYGCRVLVMDGRSTIIIVGRETSRKLVDYTLTVLIRAATNLSQAEYDKYYYWCKESGLQLRPGFKLSFLKGFIQRVQQRIQETFADEDTTGQGLMRIDSEGKLAEQFIKDRYIKNAAALSTSHSHNSTGYHRGVDIANNLDLKGKAVEEAQSRQKQLTGRS